MAERLAPAAARARRASASEAAAREQALEARSEAVEALRRLRAVERLTRRREQLGPVNPLAQEEYAEALRPRRGARGQRERPRDRAARAARGDPRHRPPDRGDLRGDLPAPRRATSRSSSATCSPAAAGRLRLVSEEQAPRAGARRAAAAEQRGRDARRSRRLPRPRSRGRRPAGAREEELLGRGDRDHAGRQVDQAPVAALRRREVDDRARVPVRGVPRAPVPVLHPRRGRGGARRPQPRPLPGAAAPLLRPRAVHRDHPPEAHDGGRRLALRRLDGRGRGLEGALAAPAGECQPEVPTSPRSAEVGRCYRRAARGARLERSVHRRRSTGCSPSVAPAERSAPARRPAIDAPTERARRQAGGGLFRRLRESMAKTRQALGSEIQATLFGGSTSTPGNAWRRR